jgi:hypothetical protein
VQKFLEFRLHRIGALLGSDLADSLVLSSSGDCLETFPLGMGQWFFDVDILARLHGPNGCQAVPMVAGCHDHRIDVGVFDESSQVIGGFSVGESGFGFGDPIRIRIAKADDFDAWDFGEASHEFIGTTTAT